MSNPFYTFAPTFVPGSLARSGDVNTQFTLVQNAFDKVNSGQPGIGTDSGSVNAVVLTMSTTRTAYNNGDEFVFMPAVQNTSATTIKVDGLPTIPLVRFNGTALQAGDLILQTWYAGRYSSALNSIEIASPAAYTSSAGIVSTAAPTHKVGLAASGGVSINVLPVDATFALDQSIGPSWTGNHAFNGATIGGSAVGTWTGAQTFNGATIGGSAIGTWSGAQTFNAGLAVNAASRNVASLAQTAQSYGNTTDNPTYSFLGSGSFTVGGNISAANFTGFATPSGNIGLTAVAGSAITAIRSDGTAALSQAITPTWTGLHQFSGNPPIQVNNNLKNALLINSSGSNFGTIQNDAANTWSLGTAATGATLGASILKWTAAGNVTINAPGSGAALTVNAVSGGDAIDLNSASGQFTTLNWNHASVTQAQAYWDSVNSEFFFGTSGSGALVLISGAAVARLVISGNGNATVNAPSSGVHTINTFGQSTALTIGIQSSGTQSGWMQFNDTTNANAVRGYIGSGSSLFTGAALGDFGMASATGSLRFSGNAGSNTHFLISSSGVVQGNDGTNLLELGYKDTPLNTPGGSYTLVASDRGKTINVSAAATITIPNGVFSGGAVISFLLSSSSCTLAQGSGLSLLWAGNGAATGNRTMTGAGLATVVFQASNQAVISGAGLS